MMAFYIGVVVLFVLALLFILWPYIRCHAEQPSSADLRQSTNVLLYRDHMADIEESLATNAITQAQYEELKLELERNLLEDSRVSEAETEPPVSSRKNIMVFGGVIAALLVASVYLYSQLGAYEAWQVKAALDNRSELERQYLSTGDTALESELTASAKQVAEKLAAAVARKPNDLQMRALLGRTAMSSGDYTLAIEQFQAILEREPELSQIMAELAQAMFLVAGNKVEPEAKLLVGQALALEPNNTVALGLSGIASFQAEQYENAISTWRQAIRLQNPNSANAVALLRGIEAAQQRLGIDPEAVAAEPQPQQQPQQPARANSVVNPTVTVEVVLADNVEASPETKVFVYARAWQGAKVPLSIARLRVADLPATITLNNAMSMTPAMNLNSAKAVELVARVSHQGTPVPQAGDWQATLGPVEITANNTQPYTLYIADEVL